MFLYDQNTIVGMRYTSSSTGTNTYYFRRNLQGDVVEIYDTNGVRKVKYNYDAWGNCTIASQTTDLVLARVNPIRYRGYYYDAGTGLYYLNARYYNPQWRRFISPDSTEYIDPEAVNGLNRYAYCNNDPINYADPSGCFALTTFGIWAIVGIVSAAMALGGGAQLASNALAGETGSDLWRGVAGAALGSGANALALCLVPFTGVTAFAVSALIGAGMQTGIDTVETLIRGEQISVGQTASEFGINVVTTFAGNWLGTKLIPTNAGWFKPQKFKSVFTKPYGQRILSQTIIGAGVSAEINFARKFDYTNRNWGNFMQTILAPHIPSYPYF